MGLFTRKAKVRWEPLTPPSLGTIRFTTGWMYAEDKQAAVAGIVELYDVAREAAMANAHVEFATAEAQRMYDWAVEDLPQLDEDAFFELTVTPVQWGAQVAVEEVRRFSPAPNATHPVTAAALARLARQFTVEMLGEAGTQFATLALEGGYFQARTTGYAARLV